MAVQKGGGTWASYLGISYVGGSYTQIVVGMSASGIADYIPSRRRYCAKKWGEMVDSMAAATSEIFERGGALRVTLAPMPQPWVLARAHAALEAAAGTRLQR